MPMRSSNEWRFDPRDIAECRRLLANGSKTFFAASFLLPRRVRDPATALYAFCRLADDAVDQGQGSPDVLSSLSWRLDQAYRGTPADCAADRAFAAAVAQFGIPRELPEALIEGFAWDAAERRYESITDLEAYAVRVAGTVGTMMALLMGARDATLLARACDLGIAMQLTNIARDVGEDARLGRVYLPLSWMREAGLDPERWLESPTFTPQLGSVIARLLAHADGFYLRSESGIARLPADCRSGIAAARFLYAEIGHEVARQGLDSVSQRAVVATSRKLQLLLRAMRRLEASAAHLGAAPADAARALVTAAASAGPVSASGIRLDETQWWDLAGRVQRVVEMFDRLERRDRGLAGGEDELRRAGAPSS